MKIKKLLILLVLFFFSYGIKAQSVLSDSKGQSSILFPYGNVNVNTSNNTVSGTYMYERLQGHGNSLQFSLKKLIDSTDIDGINIPRNLLHAIYTTNEQGIVNTYVDIIATIPTDADACKEIIIKKKTYKLKNNNQPGEKIGDTTYCDSKFSTPIETFTVNDVKNGGDYTEATTETGVKNIDSYITELKPTNQSIDFSKFNFAILKTTKIVYRRNPKASGKQAISAKEYTATIESITFEKAYKNSPLIMGTLNAGSSGSISSILSNGNLSPNFSLGIILGYRNRNLCNNSKTSLSKLKFDYFLSANITQSSFKNFISSNTFNNQIQKKSFLGSTATANINIKKPGSWILGASIGGQYADNESQLKTEQSQDITTYTSSTTTRNIINTQNVLLGNYKTGFTIPIAIDWAFIFVQKSTKTIFLIDPFIRRTLDNFSYLALGSGFYSIVSNNQQFLIGLIIEDPDVNNNFSNEPDWKKRLSANITLKYAFGKIDFNKP